jgi:outer membrane protein OmpA-like peptidoglycan-associated protein
MKTLIVIGLLVLFFLCIFFKTESIENDLTLRSTSAIQKASLPLPEIILDGRDVHISGMVDTEEIKNNIEKVVQSVDGIRVVNNSLIIKEKQSDRNDNTVAPLQQQLSTLVLNQKIEFTTGSAVLHPNSKTVLAEIADLIKNSGVKQIQIIGHTDNLGDNEKNIVLSQKRAESVKKYLVDQGVPIALLEAVGRGSLEPVADNSTSIGRKKNRRVEFKIVEEN